MSPSVQTLVAVIFLVARATEIFEDHIEEWMTEFKKYLAYNNSALAESDSSKESVVDQVRGVAWHGERVSE
jgi:hypothetical protein